MPVPFKKGHRKIAGRKRGVPNKVSREIKDIFERLVGFITDKDLFEMYTKFKKRPDIFIKMLNMIYPKDFNIKLTGSIKQDRDDLSKLTENELRSYLILVNKMKSNDTDNK